MAGDGLIFDFLARRQLLRHVLFLPLEHLLKLESGCVVARSPLTLKRLQAGAAISSRSAPLVHHNVHGVGIIHQLLDEGHLTHDEAIFDEYLALGLGVCGHLLPQVLPQLLHLAAVPVEEDRHAEVLHVRGIS